MSRFAQGTTVPVEKTKAEVEKTLIRFGATGFVSAWLGTSAAIMFEIKGRRVKFVLPLPEYGKTHGGRYNYILSREQCEAETRRRWRALLLALKAKLEVVESGIATFEEEFLAHVVLPDGKTVGQWMQPQLASVYETGRMPPLMLGAGEAKP